MAEGTSKHTPGPWTYESPDEVSIRDADGGRLAQLTFLRGRHGSGGRRTTNEVIANARLIAAAPELHAELTQLVRLLEPLERDGSLNVPGLATLSGARAALSKARGESV